MSNSVNLLSEGFERAAYNLQQSMDKLSGRDSHFFMFQATVREFEISISRFGRISGMNAANQNNPGTYSEKDFENV